MANRDAKGSYLRLCAGAHARSPWAGPYRPSFREARDPDYHVIAFFQTSRLDFDQAARARKRPV